MPKYDHIYQLATNKTLEEADIRTLHRLFYQQIDVDQAGNYRFVSVFISGSRYAVTPPNKIAAEMKKFVDWFNKNEAKIHPVEFTALTHKKFVFIHPFIDGNGRLARLLMNLALLRNEYSIALIPAILHREYIATLELAHTDDSRFCEFISDCIIATQLDLLRLLNESGGVNLPDGGVNSEIENENGGVNSMALQIMETLGKMPALNAQAIATALGKSLRTTQRILKKLCDNGKIEFKGAPKNGGYFLLVNG